ncbi:hypothetical protein CE91St62_38980 [Lachnospiraceae bacterium]|nr:hypothetical protein CE91St61_39100 [Lachnospiraceae bacterium]BDF39837.1 hypothetical protein CE91St62_38980 [Lachnospiraceae bacterium]
MVSDIDHRANLGTLNMSVVINRVNPQIKQNIHLRTFPHADKLMDLFYREEEKSRILFAGITVAEDGVFRFPIQDSEFYQLAFS